MASQAQSLFVVEDCWSFQYVGSVAWKVGLVGAALEVERPSSSDLPVVSVGVIAVSVDAVAAGTMVVHTAPDVAGNTSRCAVGGVVSIFGLHLGGDLERM